MPIPIPTGSYVVMNALTRTYLNVLCFNPVPADIVCSVGNKLGNDIVRLVHARCWLLMPFAVERGNHPVT